MALVVRANRLLAMAKDTNGLRPIIVNKIFFYLLVAPLSYSFKGHFKSTYPPISLEYQPLKVMRSLGMQTLLNMHPNWVVM